MRRALSLVLVALIGSPLWAPVPQAEAADPPPCPWSNSNLQQCSIDPTPRARGAIGLLGDSVLLGSANGMSSPGLPAMLSANEWGPVNLTATLGMRTRNNSNTNVSAWHWIDRWQRAGYRPATIALNLGGNHLADCTPANTAPCRARIVELLDKIGGGTIVWWSKFTYYPFGGAAGPGMLGWNQALDEVAAVRPNLIVWEWPAALAAADPPILMDLNRVHPRSGVEYVKRSRLIAADLDHRVGWSRRAGGPVALPPPAPAAGLTFTANTAGGQVQGPVDLAAGATTEFRVASPPGARAVAVTLQIVGLGADGYVTLHACDEPRALVSNGNFNASTWGTVQGIVRLPADGRICAFAFSPARLTFDVQGWFVDDGTGSRFSPIVPDRLLDTRLTGRAATYVLNLPGATAAALNLASVNATAAGAFRLTDCGPGSTAAQSTFPAGITVASAAYVPVSAGGQICISGPTTADLVVDLTGTFSPAGALRYTPAAAVTRLLDTRFATGGWYGRVGSGQTIDVLAGPPGAQAVTGNLTMVLPQWEGFMRAEPCGSPPPTAAVNSGPGRTAANGTTVSVTAQRMCLYSSTPTHAVFDLSGWWAP